MTFKVVSFHVFQSLIGVLATGKQWIKTMYESYSKITAGSARITIAQKYNAEFRPQATPYNPSFAVLCRRRVCPLKLCR